MRWASGSGVLLYASPRRRDRGRPDRPHLLAVALLTGAGAGVFAPAEISAVRTVVPSEDLPTALSQSQARQHVAGLVGGPLGGLCTASRAGCRSPWTRSTAVASVLLGRIRTDLWPRHPRRRGREEGRGGTALLPGLAAVLPGPRRMGGADQPDRERLFFVAVLRLIEAGFPPVHIGLVETAAGVSGIAGAIVAPWVIERVPTGWLTVVAGWTFVPLVVPMAIWNHPAVVAAALGLGLFLNPAGNAGIGAYRIAVTPAELGSSRRCSSSRCRCCRWHRPGRRPARRARRRCGRRRPRRADRARRADPHAEPLRAVGPAAAGLGVRRDPRPREGAGTRRLTVSTRKWRVGTFRPRNLSQPASCSLSRVRRSAEGVEDRQRPRPGGRGHVDHREVVTVDRQQPARPRRWPRRRTPRTGRSARCRRSGRARTTGVRRAAPADAGRPGRPRGRVGDRGRRRRLPRRGRPGAPRAGQHARLGDHGGDLDASAHRSKRPRAAHAARWPPAGGRASPPSRVEAVHLGERVDPRRDVVERRGRSAAVADPAVLQVERRPPALDQGGRERSAEEGRTPPSRSRRG